MFHKLFISLFGVLFVGRCLAGYFEDDLEYIAKAFPEETSKYCPNLPYYGGFAALAGEAATRCLVGPSGDFEITEVFDSAGEHEPFYAPIDEKITQPVILLWTNRMKQKIGYIKQCPNSACLITENRNWLNHSLTKAIHFYGTLFKITDLPLPRRKDHLWVLQHEESPKNSPVFSFRKLLELFNITSTFRQKSHYPLTTQYLRGVQQLQNIMYMKSVKEKNRLQKEEGLAPVIYVQSDCDVPSDRDRLVKWLMHYTKVDSYGRCLHNKDLPSHLTDPVKGMDHKDFIELVSKYKFAIAMENGECRDYITEKLWRPLIVGTIPITHGTLNLQEWKPDNHSTIDLHDYRSIKELSDYLDYLNKNDTAYDEYRMFKSSNNLNKKLKDVLQNRQWEPDFDAMGVNQHSTKGNFVNHFDCFVCDLIHDQMDGKKRRKPIQQDSNKEHYGCPLPQEFVSSNNLSLKRPFSDFWYSAWQSSYCDVEAMVNLSNGGKDWLRNDELKKLSRTCLMHQSARTSQSGHLD